MRTKAVRIGLHIVVWLAVYLLPYIVAYGTLDLTVLFHEPGDEVHALSTLLLIAYAYVNHYRLVPRLYLRKHMFYYALAVMAGLLIVIWFPNILHAGRGGPPHGDRPPFGHRHPDEGPPLGFFRLSYNVVLFVVCTFVSISIRQQKQLLVAQQEKLKAELSFLKAQINPHFLFNTLNSIYALSIRKSDEAPGAIIHLSELMRYILKDSDAETVPLDKELAYINHYIALQKQRLGHTVAIHYTAPAGIINKKIAPLILMSFVENAFQHGVNPSEESVIRIAISINGNQLHLEVRNRKVTHSRKEKSMGIGLKNATARLTYFYPGRHRLVIDDGATDFVVQLTLDLYD